MARMIKATPIGYRSFTNREKTKEYHIVNVTFASPDCEGTDCANIFVQDVDFPYVQQNFGIPGFTLDIFKVGNRYDYLI